MAKTKSKTKISKAVKKAVKSAAQPRKVPKRNTFGPVASINTAPVAIGNSVRGSESVVNQTKNGLVLSGRDFAFSPIGTGSIVTWTLCGGTPLAPAAFGDTSIRQYLQMYQKFRWRRLMAHYITSSPTSANGDVMFYHAKNRNSVFLNQTSSNLLPFVFSDSDTVIGPQWTNHSVNLNIKPVWKSTDYGMSADIDEYSEGELFLLSKTSTTDSPGYVIFDYVIEFAELQLSPRLLALPLPRAQWWQMSVGSATFASAVGGALLAPAYSNNISGTASTIPPGCTNGDIYKVVFDVTNSSASFTSSGLTTLRVVEGGGFTTFTVMDGTTVYALYNGANIVFYPNIESAITNSTFLEVNTLIAVPTNINWQIWMSLVTTLGATNFNPNF